MSNDPTGKEIDTLFSDLVKQKGLEAPRTLYDSIVETVTDEFSGGNEKLKSRNKEKAEIQARIDQLSQTLKKTLNIRNHRMRKANKRRAQKRASLKVQINELEQKLKDLDLEDPSTS